MARAPLSDAQKAAMHAGRVRAREAGGKARKRRARKVAVVEPQLSFNVDDDGTLAIVDRADGSGLELSLADARRLLGFLLRALPAVADEES